MAKYTKAQLVTMAVEHTQAKWPDEPWDADLISSVRRTHSKSSCASLRFLLGLDTAADRRPTHKKMARGCLDNGVS